MYVLIVLICDILIQKNILGLFITIKFTVKFAVSVHRFILDNKVYGSIVKYPDFLLCHVFRVHILKNMFTDGVSECFTS